jgi:hypothetical protein
MFPGMLNGASDIVGIIFRVSDADYTESDLYQTE